MPASRPRRCPDRADCVVGSESGELIELTSSGTTRFPLTLRGGSYRLSCATATSCLATTSADQAAVWDGSRWSLPSDIPHVNAVSCPAAGDCTAVDSTSAYRVRR